MTIKNLEPETMRECLMRALNYDDGYHSGYKQAEIDIKEQLNKEYVKGKTDGYSEGYQHGCQITKETTSKLSEQELLNSYNEGYDDCSEKLHNQMEEREAELSKLCFNDGYQVGKKEGLKVYNEGYEDGKSRGITLGLNKQAYEGAPSIKDRCEDAFTLFELRNNISDKLEQKYIQGKVEGFNEGYQKGLTTLREETTKHCEGLSDIEYDSVKKPKHYNSHPSGIQCIEVTRHYNFPIGNAIKYLWRNGLKDTGSSTEDLEKAIWYIQDEIKSIKGGQ